MAVPTGSSSNNPWAISPMGSVMTGPVTGAQVPVTLGPFDIDSTGGAIVSGAACFGLRVPFDCRLESVTMAAKAFPTGTNTFAISRHTSVATGGTAVLAATSTNASFSKEGADFATTAARNLTKGQFLVVDVVQATTQLLDNCVLVFTIVVQDFAVADNTAY